MVNGTNDVVNINTIRQGELDFGVVSVAVPVFSEDGRVLASIACSTSQVRQNLALLYAMNGDLHMHIWRPAYYSDNGLGTVIVSTPRGVLSDAEARQQNVGGEVLAEVF